MCADGLFGSRPLTPLLVRACDIFGFAGALVDAGYSDDDVIGIIGGNVLRVMEAAEAEAARLQAATIPGEVWRCAAAVLRFVPR